MFHIQEIFRKNKENIAHAFCALYTLMNPVSNPYEDWDLING